MKAAAAKAAISALNMAARTTGHGSEVRVTFTPGELPSATRREDVASYCADWSDAVGTAQAMRQHAATHGVR